VARAHRTAIWERTRLFGFGINRSRTGSGAKVRHVPQKLLDLVILGNGGRADPGLTRSTPAAQAPLFPRTRAQRNREEIRVMNEVDHIIEPTVRFTDHPVVQLDLHVSTFRRRSQGHRKRLPGWALSEEQGRSVHEALQHVVAVQLYKEPVPGVSQFINLLRQRLGGIVQRDIKSGAG